VIRRCVFNKIVFLIILIKNIRKNTIHKYNQYYEKIKNGRQGKNTQLFHKNPYQKWYNNRMYDVTIINVLSIFSE